MRETRVPSANAVLKTLEQDFNENSTLNHAASVEDKKFLKTLDEGLTHVDGTSYMPLPFRTIPTGVSGLATSKRRFRQVESKLTTDPDHSERYHEFMNDIINRGDAELVPEAELDNQNCWYLPHFRVYHPKKPQKLRVGFDCSSRERGVSLNDHLLPRPDQLNSLVGVVLRFRKEKVALLCDIGRVFHLFKVRSPHTDFLRFLWFRPVRKKTLLTDPTPV